MLCDLMELKLDERPSFYTNKRVKLNTYLANNIDVVWADTDCIRTT
jgi:hypothetical protein